MADTRQLAQMVQRMLRSGASARVRRMLDRVHSSEVVPLLSQLRPGEVGVLLSDVLPLGRVAEILDELPERELERTLLSLRDERIARVLQRLDSKATAEVLDRVGEERKEPILRHLEPERRAEVERLMSYPDATAGRIAMPVRLSVSVDDSASGVVEKLRSYQDEDIGDLYVTDAGGHLVGLVQMRKLVVAESDTPVRELLVEPPVTISALESREEAARACARYDLLSVPVVDQHHVLVGIVTVDDVFDIIEAEATQALYGIAGLEKHLRVGSRVREHLQSRLPWVLLNLLTASLGAFVVGYYESAIAKAAYLAAFMPLVAGMGGSMGSQTLTLVTRGLALGEVAHGAVTGIVLRQLLIACILGSTVGGLAAAGAWLWVPDLRLAFAVFLGMIGTFVTGALLGVLVPVGIHLLKRDPAIGSGVLVTTTTDVLGFLQFLAVAGWLLGLF